MRFLLSATVALAVLATGGIASPVAAQSCTNDYYVCLNDQVYTEVGLKKQLEAIECAVEYFGCVARKV